MRVWAVIARHLQFLAILALSLGPAGCGRATASPGDGGLCEFSTDCSAGWKCAQGQCVKLCNLASDCPESGQDCIDGGCLAVIDASCESADDCIMPGPCELSEGATCTAGSCVYPPDPICGSGLPVGSACVNLDDCTDRCVGGLCTADPPTILLIVNDKDNLVPADSQLLDRLRFTLGTTVTVRSDRDVVLNQPFDLIMIAESVTSTDVDLSYIDRSEPMMIMEGSLWFEYGLCAQERQEDEFPSLDIADPALPTAAGLSGEITVSQNSSPVFQYCPSGSVGQDGVVFLNTAGGNAVGFYYEPGNSFLGDNNRLAGLGFHTVAFEGLGLTSEAWAIFDATVEWLLIASVR